MVVYRKFLPLLFWMCLGIKKQKIKIIYTTIGKRKMLFKKSHIEFAIDCLAARGERFEGADSRGILP